MRKVLVGLVIIFFVTPMFAADPQPNWSHFTIPQGGFCYLTEIPTNPAQVRIHAITIGTAQKLGQMRADMWQTMTFQQDGSVVVSDGEFIFAFLDQAVNGIPPVLMGTYRGTGPALSQFGASSVTVDLVVIGGMGKFMGATGGGKVSGSALMKPQNPANPTDPSIDWFTPLVPFGLTNDFIGGQVPGFATPACAFMGTAEVWTNK
jgi:hypothetical protein